MDTLSIFTQPAMFAGRTILFRTNATEMVRRIREYFPAVEAGSSSDIAAEISLTADDRPNSQLEDAPWFRGRGYFAFARFTRSDRFWFNLRTRSVLGHFPRALADDRQRWHKDIFPALIGVLAARARRDMPLRSTSCRCMPHAWCAMAVEFCLTGDRARASRR